MRKKINILLHGFINLNVMDGSAVFLVGMAKMLSLNPDIRIDLVLATPINRDILLKDLYNVENINIISPFDDNSLISSNPKWYRNKRLTHNEAANIIGYYWSKKEYDWLIIRGMEVVDKLLDIQDSNISNKLMTYVTGITNNNQDFSPAEISHINKVFTNSKYLLCQTNEMRDFLHNKFYSTLNHTEIITLNPMIPDTTSELSSVLQKKEVYNKFCYVGKFHKDWNSIPMIVGFREVLEKNPNAYLSIAGDKFSNHIEIPHYNEDLKYLLENTENLFWYGALSREDARSLIINNDVGISWRDKSMDESLELSTKLLEYGSFGKPVFMNKTPMHVSIFGEDYPLYTNTLSEFVDKINLVISSPEIYYIAAERMFEVSKKFTYSETLKKLTPYLYKTGLNNFLTSNEFVIPKNFEQYNFNKPQSITKSNSEDKYYIFSLVLEDGKSVIDYVNSCSNIGIIYNIYTENSNVYTIIKRTDEPVEKNLLSNFENKLLKELLDRLLLLINYNQQNESFIKNLSLKGRTQFENQHNEDVGSQFWKNDTSRANIKSLNRRIRELEIIERKYNAIRDSKLGKLTIAYWNARKKFNKK
ncbi:glycosyltransferase [Ornithinibacillus contaminans]|uniref:glycosyltransferase n=1 Tax=Ornithinibacillus contaminans TaxID=694055 RepID=UPI00064D89D3|nr:glycosyltransferase [Ornithinibacillus contaminans]